MSQVKIKGNCWACGSEIGENDFGRSDVCGKCRRDTRACKNCDHHDPVYNNECRENQADPVLEKEKANFCDYFRPKFQKGQGVKTADELKKAAEALFKSSFKNKGS